MSPILSFIWNEDSQPKAKGKCVYVMQREYLLGYPISFEGRSLSLSKCLCKEQMKVGDHFTYCLQLPAK